MFYKKNGTKRALFWSPRGWIYCLWIFISHWLRASMLWGGDTRLHARYGLACVMFCVVVAIFTIVTRRTSNTSVVNTTLVVKARNRRSWNYTYGSYSIFITTAWQYYFSSKFNMNLPRKLTSQFAEICSMNVKNMGRTTADRNGKFNFKFQMLM